LTLLHQAIGRLDESEKEGIDGVHNILGCKFGFYHVPAVLSLFSLAYSSSFFPTLSTSSSSFFKAFYLPCFLRPFSFFLLSTLSFPSLFVFLLREAFAMLEMIKIS
jgi:hypothetical protein